MYLPLPEIKPERVLQKTYAQNSHKRHGQLSLTRQDIHKVDAED